MTTIGTAQTPAIREPSRLAPLRTTGLVALGDFLLFRHGGGAGLFVFTIAVAATTAAMSTRASSRWPGSGVVIATGAAFPLLEAPSFLAFLLAGLGLGILALGTARLLPERASALPGTLLRYALAAPFLLIHDALTVRFLRLAGWKREVLVWIVPALFIAIFGWLFWSANALFAEAIGKISFGSLLAQVNLTRFLFWLLLATVAWAVLQPRLATWRKRGSKEKVDDSDLVEARDEVEADGVEKVSELSEVQESLLFGRATVVRSLVVFNALFLIETMLDLTYLWGRVQLPDGLTYADYAHRGAFPLIATALLAAAFVLVTMRPNGPAQNNRLIRGLVYAWLAQNVLLCLSAMLRLDLYVEAYSLTEFRVAAAIWMGLVAVGLILIVLRIQLGRSNRWLIAMNFGTLTFALYASSLIDFSALIADFNVAHSKGIVDQSQWLDFSYLNSLGPTSLPAIDTFLAREGGTLSEHTAALEARRDLVQQFSERDHDWRNWSFRDARLSAYLAQHPEAPVTGGVGVEAPAR